MLSIIFNRGEKDIADKNYVFSPDTYFKYNYEDEWFDDELVKKMMQDVDHSTVLSAHSIDSPFLGIIAPERLSGGVKALIIMYKEPDRRFQCRLNYLTKGNLQKMEKIMPAGLFPPTVQK